MRIAILIFIAFLALYLIGCQGRQNPGHYAPGTGQSWSHARPVMPGEVWAGGTVINGRRIGGEYLNPSAPKTIAKPPPLPKMRVAAPTPYFAWTCDTGSTTVLLTSPDMKTWTTNEYPRFIWTEPTGSNYVGTQWFYTGGSYDERSEFTQPITGNVQFGRAGVR